MTCEPFHGPWHFGPQSGDCPPQMPDWIISRGDLGQDDELRNAAMIQLLTDRIDGGWWGDEFQPFAVGSQLWKLQGRPMNESLVLEAERMAREALEPLAAQGLFDNFAVTGSIRAGRLELTIDLIRDGETVLKFTV